MASVTPQLPGLELLEEVGRGARNLVYRARQRGRLVAVKIPRQRDDLEAIYRDYRCEASLQARVIGGGLLEVYEVGRHQDLPFIVQELVESAALSEVLKSGPYPPESTLRLGQQLASTLAAVHERGLVHRDVKPANILVSPGGPARLIDFGLATRSHLSKSNVLTGTFRYSAPEQTGMLDRPLDGRADLYALGVVLYECVTGRPPFQADDPGELIRLHALAAPPPLPEDTPAPLAQAIVRLLAKDPDDRFPSARELQRSLGHQPAGPSRRLRPLVGREELVQRLRDHWQDCQRGAGRMLLLTGAAGSGKSTLALEFARQLRTADSSLGVLRAKCNPEEPPYGLLRQLLTSTAQHIQAQPAALRAELQTILQRAAGSHAPLLGQFSPALGELLGESATAREEVASRHFLAFAEFLLRAAESLPMLVLIDDLQWIDQSSQQVLRHVAAGVHTTRSLVLATSRLEEIAEVPLPDEQCLRLGNFSQNELEQLLETTLGGPSDPRLLEQVHLASNGNPFVAAALLEAALDEGQLVPHWGNWRLEGDGLARLELPGDAIGAVVARLDPLEESQLQVLRGAAVLGLRFQAAELAKMNPLPFYPVLAEARRLKLLEKLEGDSYRFLHDRIREALLQGLEPGEERQLHARAAHTVGPEQAFRYAQHLWHSHPEANRETCLAQRSAGLLASRQHAYQEACEFFARAQSSQPTGLENTAECAEAHGYACYLTGRFSEALALLQSALPLCSTGLARAQVHQRLAEVYMVEIDTEQAWPAVVRGLRELDIHFSSNAWQGARAMLGGLAAMAVTPLGKSRDPKTRAAVRLLEVGARVCFIGGYIPQFVEVLVRGLRLARQLGASSALAAFYSILGLLLSAAGARRWAIQYGERSVAMAEQFGDPTVVAQCQLLSSVALRLAGQDLSSAERVSRLLVERGAWLPTLDYLIGVVDLTHNYHFRGQLGKAHECAQMGQRRIGQDHFPLVLTSTLSPVYSAVGRHAEARYFKQVCREFFDRKDSPVRQSAFLVSSLHAEMERGELGAEVEDLIEQFRKLKMDVARGPLPLRAFTILEARVRYQQAMADRSRLPQFKQALDRVRRSQGHPMFTIHHRALQAGYQRLLGNPARSRQLLAQAENLAHSDQNYWIMIEVAKQRAYLLRDQQLFEAAALQARAAAAMADELGWLAQVHRIEAEFALNLHSNSGSNREGSSQNATTLRLQRHLKALLEVTQATAQVLDVPRISELVLAEVLRILAAERAFLFLMEDEGLRFQTGRSAEGQILSLPDNYATSVVEQVKSRGRASLLSADEGGQITSSASIQTHNLRSILAAPMLWRDRLVGVVYLDSRLARGAFSSDDVEVLQALANQVAVSLETARAARLEVQVRGERDQRLLAEQLSEMVGSLLTHLQTEAVLTRLLEGLQRVVGFRSAATLLVQGECLTRVATQGPSEVAQERPLEGVWTEVLHSNRPLLLEDDHWLGAALPSAQGPVGMLVLQRESPFRRAEVELVHTLASYAGIALENSQLFASVQRMATIDELTGILNRRQFLKEANEELQRADRLGHAVSLVMFDVDHFKKFNDTHGHAIGDLVLRTVSARCKDCLRGIDHLGRLGGEEFAVLLVGTPLEPGCATADRLRLAICGQPFPSSQGDLSVAISLGVAQRQPKEKLDQLLERADEALYAAKRGGRNRVEAR